MGSPYVFTIKHRFINTPMPGGLGDYTIVHLYETAHSRFLCTGNTALASLGCRYTYHADWVTCPDCLRQMAAEVVVELCKTEVC